MAAYIVKQEYLQFNLTQESHYIQDSKSEDNEHK